MTGMSLPETRSHFSPTCPLSFLSSSDSPAPPPRFDSRHHLILCTTTDGPKNSHSPGWNGNLSPLDTVDMAIDLDIPRPSL